VYTDVLGNLTTDYQNWLEKRWIESLEKKYPVNINRAVLDRVNNH
jgi:peptidyl-prolyl cis-trans isomerase SurA